MPLLISLQQQLAIIAKSSAFVGKVDVERHAKLALVISARLQADLQRGIALGHRKSMV